MRKTLLFLALICASSRVFAGTISDIPADRQVILESKWTPTAQQTRDALNHIQIYLNKVVQEGRLPDPTASPSPDYTVKASKEILSAHYRVQFTGTFDEGKKAIVCNFFPAANSGEEDNFAYWKRSQVMVDDGGSNFWMVKYNIVTRQIVVFSVNGVALQGASGPSIYLTEAQ